LRRALAGWLAAAACVAAAGCASSPHEDGIEVVLDPGSEVDEATLRAAAAFEIAAFDTHGRDEADLADAADTMSRTLRAQGYPRGRVRHELTPGEGGEPAAARLVVTEGRRAFVSDVTLPGAKAFPVAELRAQFLLPQTGLGRTETPLRMRKIESAVDAVRARYQGEGFLEAQVGPAVLTWNDDRTRADVSVPVTEGRQWKVSHVRIEGVADAALARAIHDDLALVEKPFSSRTASLAAAHVRRYLGDRGHLQAEAAASDVRDEPNARAEVVVRVTVGPLARLGDVLVEGLDRTDADFARGLAEVRPGDVLTLAQVDAWSKALSDTGVFRSVAVEPRPRNAGADAPPSGESTTDLAAAVREIQARMVDFELGWGSYELLRGRVRYLDRNFAGRAATFGSEVSASFRGAAVGAWFEDPYLVGDEITFRIGGDVGIHEEPEFVENRAEFETSLSRSVGEHTKLTGGYRLRALRATSVDAGLAGAEDPGYTRAGGLFARIEDDRTDDPFFPRTGTESSFETFWSSPTVGADLDFVELAGTASHYIPLGSGTVLVLAARATTREILDDRQTLPIQERLFLGGEDSVRSFGQDELAPLNALGKAAGGLTTAEAHVELRQRLYGPLDGALFYDVGWVGGRSFDFAGAPGIGIGAGLRYRLPVGPIRLDVAWNPGDLRAANTRWGIHLSFGFAF